jgi:hypothetical protein
MLLNPHYGNDIKVAWTNSKISVKGMIESWHLGSKKQTPKTIPNWSGVHLFAHYQTENDLYVASYRYDRQIVMKKKRNDTYTTLTVVKDQKEQMSLHVGKNVEFIFAFETINSKDCVKLACHLNGKLISVFEDTDDDRIQWGTHGIRTDYSDVIINSIKVD